MKKPMANIRVLDRTTNQVLFECSMDESEKAYQFAAQMEEMGLDLVVEAPTLSDTLSDSLGLTREQQQAYKESMEEEMDEHDDGSGSCCFKESDSSTKH